MNMELIFTYNMHAYLCKNEDFDILFDYIYIINYAHRLLSLIILDGRKFIATNLQHICLVHRNKYKTEKYEHRYQQQVDSDFTKGKLLFPSSLTVHILCAPQCGYSKPMLRYTLHKLYLIRPPFPFDLA